jgi:hypothetical protein
VPPLLNAGGSEAVFGTFAAFFGVAIVGALLLPEWKGRDLAEDEAGPQHAG